MADALSRTGRAIAGLIGYNPGPGIYSRLERAVQAMPESVRVDELPGLLKRYKDGVPGWELKATDLDSVIAGRDIVPRAELLARVQERSPVYTHKEVVLGGNPPTIDHPNWGRFPDSFQDGPSRLGEGVNHGEPKWRDRGQGGSDYTELLLVQPGARDSDFDTHWLNAAHGADDAVAHARYDIHGDALRINELQSDLGIHNRKMRAEAKLGESPPPQEPGEPSSHYLDRALAQGYQLQRQDDGAWGWVNNPAEMVREFPLEDAWADVLIKRLALEAARKGHRAIEVASPTAIFNKVGNPMDAEESLAKMRHLYDKVVPGAIERLGRKMGGVIDESPAGASLEPVGGEPLIVSKRRLMNEIGDYEESSGLTELTPESLFRDLSHVLTVKDPERLDRTARRLHDSLIITQGMTKQQAAQEMPRLMYLAGLAGRATDDAAAYTRAIRGHADAAPPPPGRRYIMSDEMRRRIIQEGIPAAVAAGMVSDKLIERLGEQ